MQKAQPRQIYSERKEGVQGKWEDMGQAWDLGEKRHTFARAGMWCVCLLGSRPREAPV